MHQYPCSPDQPLDLTSLSIVSKEVGVRDDSETDSYTLRSLDNAELYMEARRPAAFLGIHCPRFEL